MLNALSRINSALHLRLDHHPDLGKTTLHVLKQTPPLRVVRGFPLPDGSALVHLHNISGGVLGGDCLELDIAITANAHAQITTPGAMRIYKHRAGFPDASQHTRIVVESGGLLEYLPDPIIPFAQSRYRQSTEIHLAHDAGLFWWETIAPGRIAYGEQFAYDLFENRVVIHARDQVIALERYRLCPQLAPLPSLVRMGGYLYHTSFYVCRVGVPESDWLALEQESSAIAQQHTQLGSTLWGVSTLPSDGLVIRGFSTTYRQLWDQLTNFWRVAKQRLYEREIIAPRKNY